MQESVNLHRYYNLLITDSEMEVSKRTERGNRLVSLKELGNIIVQILADLEIGILADMEILF